MLSELQVQQYRDQGFVIVEGAIDSGRMTALRLQTEQWMQESLAHTNNYGRMIDGRARFEIEAADADQSAALRLRRVGNPCDISAVYRELVFASPVGDLLTPLLGADVKFDHCKLNLKLPGMLAEVKPHQDHAFEPQTNDDVAVVLLALDDTTVANGALRVVPDSHRERHSHYQDGVFTGTVGPAQQRRFASFSVPLEVAAGGVILMNTWTVHGSPPNASDQPRRLFVAEYKAADAFPLTPHKLPSEHTEQMVRGRAAAAPRYRIGSVELPPYYADGSVFSVQADAVA